MTPTSRLLCLAIAAWTGNALAAGERSEILTMGKPAGFQQADYAADGTLKVHFEFNDRGRGPKIDASYKIAADGTLETIDSAGVNYLKSAVQEHFERRAAKATWKNSAEDQSRDVDGPAFYQSIDGTPEEYPVFARALLKAPKHSMNLLPAGEAHIEKVGSEKIKSKAGSKTVTLYAITGLDLTASYIWLDEQQRFFATYSPWSSTVREGYGDVLEQIGKRQDAEEKRLAQARAAKLTQKLTKPLAIEHARVFDPATGNIAEDQTVVIEKGRIAAVGKDVSLPAGAQRIDAHGRFLMPGLWDMHAHYNGGYEGLLDIAGGVTTARDLANDADALAMRIADIEAGRDIGPRIIKAGFVDGHSPFSGPTKVFVDSAEDAKTAVDKYAATGYEQIKIYSSIKPELVPIIAKLAHDHGLRVSGHVPSFMTSQQFVEAGADEIQHINFVVMSFVTDVAKDDTRTPLRFTAIGQNAAKLDLSTGPVHDFVGFLRDHHTVIDPTLSTFEDMFTETPGHPGPTLLPWVDHLPPTWQRSILAGTGGLPMTVPQEALYRESYRRLVDLVGVLYRSGVTLVAGTDGIGGMQLQRELELYVSAGIPPKDVLRIATLGGAEVMKRGDRYGHVAPGYVADLILVDGDPTINIGDIRKVRDVIRGDRRFDPAAIYAALGMKP